MARKRKTRKQKEESSKRKQLHVHKEEIPASIKTPTYRLDNLDKPKKEKKDKDSIVNESDFAYLRNDIKKIITASGIILSFDILLFALLSTGVIRLPAFGY